jgi:hypothetical protein
VAEVVEVQIYADHTVYVIIALKHKSGQWARPSFTSHSMVPEVRDLLLKFVRSHDWAEGLSKSFHREGVAVVGYMDPKAPIQDSHRAAFDARIISPVLLTRTFPDLIK